MATPTEKPKRRGNLMTFVMIALVMIILFDPRLRDAVAGWVGVVLMPVIGFGGEFPVLTIMVTGALMVVLTTLIRHFTTDWLELARTQAIMRHFQKEMSQARKDNNTYRMKKLQDAQPKIMEAQQKTQMATMKTMPYTMIVVIPLFAWLFVFLDGATYWWFTAPWNPTVDMFAKNGILFGSSVLPHWILLYTALSIPLGALLNKGMKYLSWKERWKQRHPEVHE